MGNIISTSTDSKLLPPGLQASVTRTREGAIPLFTVSKEVSPCLSLAGEQYDGDNGRCSFTLYRQQTAASRSAKV